MQDFGFETSERTVETNATGEALEHADFVTGVRSGQMGFRCIVGEPSSLLRGVRKGIFGALVLLWALGPLVLIPVWAVLERNWWVLLGAPVSYAASISATWKSRAVILYLLVCIGWWISGGFSLHSILTIFCLCALWGYTVYLMADGAQHDYALQSLIESRDLFDQAVARGQIVVVRRPAKGQSNAPLGDKGQLSATAIVPAKASGELSTATIAERRFAVVDEIREMVLRARGYGGVHFVVRRKSGTQPVTSANREADLPQFDPSTVKDLASKLREIESTFANAGIADREERAWAVHYEIRNIIPEMSERDVMDALSGSGKYGEKSA